MKHVLMEDDEPSDLELTSLMIEVAKEAKSKAMIEKQHLSETVANQIAVLQTKMNPK